MAAAGPREARGGGAAAERGEVRAWGEPGWGCSAGSALVLPVASAEGAALPSGFALFGSRSVALPRWAGQGRARLAGRERRAPWPSAASRGGGAGQGCWR